MQIENNILKYYLQNVYFITGTAYAGKSTAAKMLAEKYGMIPLRRKLPRRGGGPDCRPGGPARPVLHEAA